MGWSSWANNRFHLVLTANFQDLKNDNKIKKGLAWGALWVKNNSKSMRCVWEWNMQETIPNLWFHIRWISSGFSSISLKYEIRLQTSRTEQVLIECLTVFLLLGGNRTDRETLCGSKFTLSISGYFSITCLVQHLSEPAVPVKYGLFIWNNFSRV